MSHTATTDDTTHTGIASRPSTDDARLHEPDAAQYIAYTTAALRKWRAEGRGPAYVRHGRSVRYLRSDLDAWLAAHRVEPRGQK